MSIKSKVALGGVAVLLFIAVIVFLLGPVLFASIAYPLPEKYRGSIAKWSKEYCGNIKDGPNLVAALIMTESGWRESAHSSAGAIGMTQFIPSTAVGVAKKLGVTPFTPSDLTKDSDLSIRFGAYYICTRIGDYGGNVQKGLIAYNGGGGAVIAFERGSPVRGTVGYASKVVAIQQAYTTIYGRWWENPLPASNSGGGTEFKVVPKTDTSLIMTVPILDFWQGLLSNQDTGSSDEQTDGGLNNLWKVFLPSE